jgi:hypothetical protein
MVKQKQYARAYASFCEIEHLVLEPSDKDLPLAKMFVGIGDLARAREYVERALLARPGYEMMAGVFAFSCGKIFDDLGDHARAAELRSEFFETARKVPMILQPLLPQLIAADDEVSIKLVQDFAEKEFSHNEDLMLFMARTCVQRSMKAIHDGDISAATEMSAIAFRFAPKDKHVAGVYNALSKGRLPLWILRAANVSTEQIQPAVQNESSSEA